MAACVLAGFAIGIVAAIMGVAGGQLIIPNCSAAVRPRHQSRRDAVPRRVAPDHARRLGRYSQDTSFVVLRHNVRLVLAMAAGSVAGAVVGRLLLGVVPSVVLILVASWWCRP